MVIFDVQNIWTSHGIKSLFNKNLGLFQIIKVIDNSAYKLKLSLSMISIFSEFHLVLHYLDNNNSLPELVIFPLPPIMVNEDIDL